MKILIYGAGVIGQIYAARLHEAGHDLTVLARHQTLETLARDGITLVNGAQVNGTRPGPVRVNVTGRLDPASSFELALVTVRRDQVDEILPALPRLKASQVVMMQNNSLELARIGDLVGRDGCFSASLASAGTAGTTAPSPTSRSRSSRRPWTAAGPGGYSRAALASAGFAVATTADMDGWLKTHGVFIAAMCTSINSCGGDAVKLAADRGRVATMISAAGEGFRALASQGWRSSRGR